MTTVKIKIICFDKLVRMKVMVPINADNVFVENNEHLLYRMMYKCKW